jgi:hypothetical protein
MSLPRRWEIQSCRGQGTSVTVPEFTKFVVECSSDDDKVKSRNLCWDDSVFGASCCCATPIGAIGGTRSNQAIEAGIARNELCEVAGKELSAISR